MPGQCKHILTAQGRTLITALNAILAVSAQQLTEIAA